jgi:hypothetical protein
LALSPRGVRITFFSNLPSVQRESMNNSRTGLISSIS